MNIFRFFARIRRLRWMATPCVIAIVVFGLLMWNVLVGKILEKKKSALFSAANKYHRNLAQREIQKSMDPRILQKYYGKKEENNYADQKTVEEMNKDPAYNFLMNAEVR